LKFHDHLLERHVEFIRRQHVFFVGTAPLSGDGRVNVSPKGLDSFAVLDPSTVAYLDLGGSGIETHAHVKENGRICIMFCSFDEDPLIVRLYGHGSAHAWGSPEFDALRPSFPAITAPARGILKVEITGVQDSCGWGVPHYEFLGPRKRLEEQNAKRTQEEFMERRFATNGESIDGLPGLVRPS